MAQYITTLTEDGKELILNSLNGGAPLKVSHMGIGTATTTGANAVVPTTKNISELIDITSAKVHPKYKEQLTYSAILTASNDPYPKLPFTIEKIYLFADISTTTTPDLVLFSVTDFPPTPKLRTDNNPQAVMSHNIEVVIKVHMDNMGDRTIKIEEIDSTIIKEIGKDLFLLKHTLESTQVEIDDPDNAGQKVQNTKISNVAPPDDWHDVVNRAYLEEHYVSTQNPGDVLPGDLTTAQNDQDDDKYLITGSAHPRPDTVTGSDRDLVTKKYVDDEIAKGGNSDSKRGDVDDTPNWGDTTFPQATDPDDQNAIDNSINIDIDFENSSFDDISKVNQYIAEQIPHYLPYGTLTRITFKGNIEVDSLNPILIDGFYGRGRLEIYGQGYYQDHTHTIFLNLEDDNEKDNQQRNAMKISNNNVKDIECYKLDFKKNSSNNVPSQYQKKANMLGLYDNNCDVNIKKIHSHIDGTYYINIFYDNTNGKVRDCTFNAGNALVKAYKNSQVAFYSIDGGDFGVPNYLFKAWKNGTLGAELGTGNTSSGDEYVTARYEENDGGEVRLDQDIYN